jgi:hypothetical protein
MGSPAEGEKYERGIELNESSVSSQTKSSLEPAKVLKMWISHAEMFHSGTMKRKSEP